MHPDKLLLGWNGIKENRLVWFCIGFIILLRILFTAIMGLMPQDVYYLIYSQNLELSYFDHPPAIAYMLKLFTSIFGETAFAIKFASLVVTSCTIISFYYLCKHFTNKETLNKAFLLLISTFMVTILSIISTPDVPLMLFWTLSLSALYQAVFLGKKSYWLIAGLLMGLAFDSKYTGIFLPVGLTLFLVLSANYRKYLFSIWYWLAAFIFLVTISPVVIWNAQNNFASFRFQSTNHTSLTHGLTLNIKYFFGVIGHQSAILIPILFFGLLYFLFKSIKKNRFRIKAIPPTTSFLLCFFLPLLFIFFSISFFFWVKLNWLMPVYITGIIWASRYFSNKWIRIQAVTSLIIHCALAFQIVFYFYPVKSDDTWYGWQDLANQVETVHAKHADAFLLSADGYKTSAMLNFYMKEKVYYPNAIGLNALEMDYIPENLSVLNGKDAMFIDSSPEFKDDKKAETHPSQLDTYFNSVEEIEPILVKNNGQTIRKFFVYICNDYHPAHL